MQTVDQSFTTSHRDLLNLIQQVSLGVEQALTPAEAFPVVLSSLCRFMGWPLGHVFVWSDAAGQMVSTGIWYDEAPSTMTAFRALSERTTYAPGEGTVGRVRASGDAETILDVQAENERSFVRRLPVEEGGIRAYFAYPVRIEDEVAAVIEFFSPNSVAPDPDTVSVINHVSIFLGLALQRQQAFSELQHSQAQLEEAQRIAHVGHWEWDTSRDEVTWSPELYRIFGLSPNLMEATREGVIRYIHPTDLDYSLQKFRDAYERGIPFDHFIRIIRPDGATRLIHSRGRPVYDQAGQIARLHGTAQDMTEEKETELKLAETVRQLSAMMEIGQAISASLDLASIYNQVMTLVRPLLGAEAVLLLLNRENALEIVAMDHEGLTDMRGMRMPVDTGIVGSVWREEESLFVSAEASRLLNLAEFAESTGYQPEAALAVPVRWRNRPVGILVAFHRTPNAFEEEDLRLLEMTAAWTAIAIGNARQYEQLQRRLTESNAIVTISNAFTKTLDLEELLQLIADRVQETVRHAEWTTIHLLNREQDMLDLVANAGLEIDTSDYLIKSGEGIAGHVITTGEALNIPDVQLDPRRLPIDVYTQARSLLVAPVQSRHDRIGTISMQSSATGRFDAEDERLLTLLGLQAGMAIENARLYNAQDRARARAERQRERMRHMARRVVMAQEEERARIARELHDESGQSLTSLKISLGLLRGQLPDELVAAKNALDDLLKLTDTTMSNLRLLSHNLRPPGLDIYGLDAALTGLCHDFQVHTGLIVNYVGDETLSVESLSALSLYRFTQEALTNAVKHAEATEIQVTLAKESDNIKVVVCDNGRGFTPPDLDEDSSRGGVGLLGMIERLEMVNGQMVIESSPGQGSRLTAIVPDAGDAK